MAITKKKGETVHMYAFTGMYLGEFTVEAADKDSVTITQKNGRVTKFDRKTGKQIDAKTPRCASHVSDEKEAAKAKPAKKAKKAAPAEEKKPAKKAKKAPEPEEDDDEEDYEEA